MADECIRCEGYLKGICHEELSPFYYQSVERWQACDLFDPKPRGKTCDYCGKTHDDYSGSEYLFPTGVMINLTCNYCGGYNGLWAVTSHYATRIG